MDQKLAVTKIEGLKEVEPMIFELTLVLEGGDKARVRMNMMMLQTLKRLVDAR
jgi:hypothetical protein